MKINENYNSKHEDEDDDDKGGSAGGIESHYKDASSTLQRDDMLSPEELKRLLAVHKDMHKSRVDKQKITRKERKEAKEGPVNLTTRKAYQEGKGYGAGYDSKYKTHPIAVKFSGIRDQKISAVPSENTAETNQEQKQELENKNENKLRLNYQPGFNPKPKPY